VLIAQARRGVCFNRGAFGFCAVAAAGALETDLWAGVTEPSQLLSALGATDSCGHDLTRAEALLRPDVRFHTNALAGITAGAARLT